MSIGAPTAERLPGLQMHRLSNGLLVLVQPDHRVPLVALEAWYPAGSAWEQPTGSGLAHLAEHSLFSAVEEGVNAEGVSYIGPAQASVATAHARFARLVPAGELERAIETEGERLAIAGRGVARSVLERERRVIVNELQQRQAQRTQAMALAELHRLLFPQPHPYHHPPTGDVRSVDQLRGQDVQVFLRQRYRPSGATLVLCGDLRSDRVLQVVEATFPSRSAVHAENEGGELQLPVLPASVGWGASSSVAMPSAEPACYLAFALLPRHQCERSRAALLASLLAVGKSSLLHDMLVRTRRLARRVGAVLTTLGALRTVTIYAIASEGADLDELELALLGGLREVGERPLPASLVERARRRTLLEHLAAHQTFSRRAYRCAELATSGVEPQHLDDEPDLLRRATVSDLQDLLQRLLRDTTMARVRLTRGETRR